LETESAERHSSETVSASRSSETESGSHSSATGRESRSLATENESAERHSSERKSAESHSSVRENGNRSLARQSESRNRSWATGNEIAEIRSWEKEYGNVTRSEEKANASRFVGMEIASAKASAQTRTWPNHRSSPSRRCRSLPNPSNWHFSPTSG
jgi:hypothetical protein